MSRGRAAGALVTALAVIVSSGCTPQDRVASREAACALATARVTAHRGLPVSHVATCDPASEADDQRHYVLALRAHCREELCGSTLMGWFAVRKRTGEVFEWDVAESAVGRPLSEAE